MEKQKIGKRRRQTKKCVKIKGKKEEVTKSEKEREKRAKRN